MLIRIEIEVPQVELICENKYGKLYHTSEGYHINGDVVKFINNVKKDLRSPNNLIRLQAEYILDIIANEDSV
jgi:hypothetical protein